jgi:hypothetical protein
MKRTATARWLALAAAAALVTTALTGGNTAAADPAPLDHPQAQAASALRGCPADSALYVPDQQGIARYGAVALVPANLPQVRRAAAGNPALRRFTSPGTHWLDSVSCGRSTRSNGPREGTGPSRPGTFTPSPGVNPLDTPVQRYCTVVTGVDCEANWSGYETGPGAPTGMKTGAWMDWNVPTQKSSDDNDDVISVWPGIGTGSQSDYLVQAGTESDQSSYLGGIFKTHSYTAWYEVVPGENEVPIDSLAVHPGDHMSVLVFYDPTTKMGTFLLENQTTNDAVEMEQAVPGPTGSQSEWIVERSCSGGSPSSCDYQRLGNYGTEHVFFAGGNVTNGNTISPITVGDSDPQQIPMTNCARTEFLAWVDYVDSTGQGFDDVWQNYGPVETAGCP